MANKTTTQSLHNVLLNKTEGVKVTLHTGGVQLPVGNGMLLCRNQLMRLRWEYEITTGTLTGAEREDLYAFIAYHRHRTQGSGAQGAVYNFGWNFYPTMRNGRLSGGRVLLGFGDGTTKDFFLPTTHTRNHVGTTITIYVNGVAKINPTDWGHIPGPAWTQNDHGQIRFVTAPADDDKIEATYASENRLIFVETNGQVAETERIGEDLFRMRFRMMTHTGSHGNAFPEP